MGHEKYNDLLSDALDGRLTAADAEDLNGHLQGCADCRTLRARYRVIDAAARRAAYAPSARETDAFAQAVRSRLEASPEAAFLSALLATPRRGATAFALALAALFLAVRPAARPELAPEAQLVAAGGGTADAWTAKSADETAAGALNAEFP